MDASVEVAIRHYESVRRACSKYYQAHKDEISQQRKQKYRADHPNANPRGRPKKNKNQEETINNNNADGLQQE